MGQREPRLTAVQGLPHSESSGATRHTLDMSAWTSERIAELSMPVLLDSLNAFIAEAGRSKKLDEIESALRIARLITFEIDARNRIRFAVATVGPQQYHHGHSPLARP